MPARWRGGATVAFPPVQGPPSFEDAVDGPHRGERFGLADLEGLVDGLRSMEPQITRLLQLAPHGQDQILDGGFGPVRGLGVVGPVVPVHSVEPLPLSEVDPVVDGRLAHVELLGDLVLRAPPSDGGDDRPTTEGLPIILWLMSTSGERCGFPLQNTAE